MATIDLIQTDTSKTAQAGCSGVSLSSGTPAAREMTDGGTAGVTEVTLSLAANSTEVMWNDISDALVETTWADGTLTWRLNVTASNMAATLDAVYVCRFDSSDVSQETLGSSTSIGLGLATNQVESGTVTITAATTPADTDKIAIIFSITNGNTHSAQSLGITPDQTINTPIERSVSEVINTALPVAGLATTTGYAPTVESITVNVVTPDGGGEGISVVTTIGYAPTIDYWSEVKPSDGLVETVGYAPTVTTILILEVLPSDGLTEAIGYAPTVSVPSTKNADKKTTMGLFGSGMGKYLGFAAKSGAPAEASPSSGLVDVAGYAPTVDYWTEVKPSDGLVETVGYAPTLETGSIQVVTPSAGLTETTGYAPTITLEKATSPSSGLVETTGYAPSLQVTKIVAVAPASGLVSATGYASTVDTGFVTKTRLGLFGFASSAYPGFSAKASAGADEVIPASGLVDAIGYAPTIVVDQIVEPATGLVTTTGYAPSSLPANAVSPTTGLVETTGYAPAVAIARTQVTRGGLFGYGAAAYPGFTAKSATGQEVLPVSGLVNTIGYTATITYEGVREPATGLVTVTGYTPSLEVVGSLEVSPSTGVVNTTGYAPETDIGQRGRISGLGLFGYGMGRRKAFAVKASSNIEETYPQTGLVTTVGQTPLYPIELTPATGSVANKGHLYNNTWFNADWFNPRWFTDKWFFRDTVISFDQQFVPASGVVNVVGYAPSVDYQVGTNTVAPSTGVVTVTGAEAITSPGYTVTPASGLATTAGSAPSMTKENGTWPASGLVSESGYAPSVTVTRPNDLAPIVGIVNASGGIIGLTFELIDRQPATGLVTTTSYPPLVSTIFSFPSGSVVNVVGYAPGVDTRRWVLEPQPSSTWDQVSAESATWSTTAEGSANWSAETETSASWSVTAKVPATWS